MYTTKTKVLGTFFLQQILRKRLWEGGIPFIFNSSMKYENNIDDAPDKLLTDHEEP